MKIYRRIINLPNAVANRNVRDRALKLVAESLRSKDAVPPRPERPVIVIGMHRSGTTLMVQLLEDLGAAMGKWKGKNTSEALFFRRRNEVMFSLAHATWDNPEPLIRAVDSPVWRRAFTRIAAHDLGSLRSLSFAPPASLAALEDSGGGEARLWGFKDPRTSLTLPVWLNVFPNAKVIHIVRHGSAVAASLRRRAQGQLENDASLSMVSLDTTLSLNLWAEYVLAAHRNCAALSEQHYLEVRYENLIGAPKAVLQELAAFVGVRAGDERLEKSAARVDRSRNPALLDSPVTQKAQEALALYNYQV